MSEITAAFGRAERLIFDTMDENRKLRAINADMLAALKEAEWFLAPALEDTEETRPADNAMLARVRAAIAKAEGKEP